MRRPPAGYLGFTRQATATAASGVWTLNEASLARRYDNWPTYTPPGSVSVPSAPTNLTLAGDIFWDTSPQTWFDSPTSRTNGRIIASWGAPSSNGGAPISGYVVQLTNYLDQTRSVTVSESPYQFSNVEWATDACTTSTISVKAVNSAGEGTAATATIRLPRANAPTLKINSKTPETGAPGATYVIQWSPECVQEWTGYEVQRRRSAYLDESSQKIDTSEEEYPWGSSTTVDDEIETATIFISDADASSFYKFRVRATGQSASSDWSNVVEE